MLVIEAAQTLKVCFTVQIPLCAWTINVSLSKQAYVDVMQSNPHACFSHSIDSPILILLIILYSEIDKNDNVI